MGQTTGIEWTDATWNPVRGCSMVSAGCTHCYAQTVAHRFSGPGQPYEGLVQLGADGKSTGKWNGVIRFVEERLLDPLRWKTPRRIFVNSMSDLFHENVTDAMRDRIFAVMALCPQHTFQVLTKRPERMQAYLNTLYGLMTQRLRLAEIAESIVPGTQNTPAWLRNHAYQPGSHHSPPLPNVHHGVSGEEQETATKRSWVLLKTVAAVRFLSAEPLIGGIDLDEGELVCRTWRRGATIGTYLDWVIAGGESGPGARPMHPDWARSLRDQCKAAGVPFFFKQWGEWYPTWGGGTHLLDRSGVLIQGSHEDPRAWQQKTHEPMRRVGKKAAGHLLDGVAHREFPAVTA